MNGYLTMLMFFSVPIAAIIFFVVSLVLFLTARSTYKSNPDEANKVQLNTRRILFIISSAIAFVVLSVVVTLVVLFSMALAYM